MTEHTRIAGAGICCLDHLFTTAPLGWGGAARIRDWREEGGGLVATALVACSRLGADTLFYGRVGTDAEGDLILRGLDQERVPVENITRLPDMRSPLSLIHVNAETGERTIFHRRANRPSSSPPVPDLSLLASCSVLLIDAYYPDLALAAARVARAHRIPVIADIIPAPEHVELLREVDVLIAPRHFAADIGKEHEPEAALDVIHAYGPTTAVITLGADGWVYSGPEGRGCDTAYEIDVVDTTGAGDVFHGAYAFALAGSASTRECCRFAAAVAALKCTMPGGRAGIPDLAHARALMASRSAGSGT